VRGLDWLGRPRSLWSLNAGASSSAVGAGRASGGSLMCLDCVLQPRVDSGIVGLSRSHSRHDRTLHASHSQVRIQLIDDLLITSYAMPCHATDAVITSSAFSPRLVSVLSESIGKVRYYHHEQLRGSLSLYSVHAEGSKLPTIYGLDGIWPWEQGMSGFQDQQLKCNQHA
jgi:hypothetical protein